MQDVHLARLLGHIIEDAVGPEDNFAKGSFGPSWVCRPNEGKLGQNLNLAQNAPAHSQGGFRVMLSDV